MTDQDPRQRITHHAGEVILFFQGIYADRQLVDGCRVLKDLNLVEQARSFADAHGPSHTARFVEHLVSIGFAERMSYDVVDCGDEGFDPDDVADFLDRPW
ncbi:MAG TPA: hypothetical protein VN624_19160 [Rhodanobacter sp.]|nr:hypothetical protein [Rhodanobacter sp.]